MLLYVVAFAAILDRPLSLGALEARVNTTLGRARATSIPKLVILAGSNGPFSHRCETIAPIVGRPCINAGVAVGVGLDYLFARWKPELHAGDVVYMPLEEAQYVRDRNANGLGPDAAIMLRHDHATLRSLPAGRRIAALFSGDPRTAIMSVIETALARSGFRGPPLLENDCGDRIGHTATLAKRNASALAIAMPVHPDAAHIQSGYGSTIIGDFLDWTRQNGVTAIGGLPVGFIDSPIPDDSIAAIAAIFHEHATAFLIPPNQGRYARSAFFDTPDHLNEDAQIAHSVLIGKALAVIVAKSAPSR